MTKATKTPKAASAPPEEVRPIDDLNPDAKNARMMDGRAMAGLGYSLETFGDLSGITWNEPTGELVCGHQRMDRLRAAGATFWKRLSPEQGVIVHPKTGETFYVRIVNWPVAKQRAANLVANNPHIQGEFTGEAIEQLKALENEAFFEALRLDDMTKELEKELASEIKKSNADKEASDESGKLSETFAILIECTDEAEQINLLERFGEEGIKCRALT